MQEAAAQDPVGGAIVGGATGAIIGGVLGGGRGAAIVRSSVVPLVPLSVQKASRGRVVTVITRMLVIKSSPTEHGLLFRLTIVRPHRLMLKTTSA